MQKFWLSKNLQCRVILSYDMAMKFGSLKSKQSPDGEPILVSRNNSRAIKISHLERSLREIIENWAKHTSELENLYKKLNDNSLKESFAVEFNALHSPLPRSFQWADGSAFVQHIKLVRQARNAPMPENIYTVPLMYQGGSDSFLAPLEDIPLIEDSHGLDFEAEVGVITDFVPMQTKPSEALSKIRLLVIINDVSLRGLIPEELAAGFGFFQSKPSSAFGPFAVTPDELGEYWKDGRIHLPLNSDYNGQFFGNPNAKEMHFHFGELIAHAAKTRNLTAGTIIGSGTVANEDRSKGSSCIVEKRMLEKIETGEFKTPFMKVGDSIKIEMCLPDGQNIFGTINQKIIKAPTSS